MLKQKKLMKTIKFMSLLLFFGILLHSAQSLLANEVSQSIVASQTSFVLNILGVPSYSIGNIISMGKIKGIIIPECVGLYGIFAILALFLATPDKNLKSKLIALSWSLPSIYIINIFRLSTSFYTVYNYGIPIFDFVHDFLWRTLLLISSLAMWILWLNYNKNKKDNRG